MIIFPLFPEIKTEAQVYLIGESRERRIKKPQEKNKFKKQFPDSWRSNVRRKHYLLPTQSYSQQHLLQAHPTSVREVSTHKLQKS